MIISIPTSIYDKCQQFANECVKTNKYYASRGQSNVEKITNDILVGKLGEWASYIMLIEKGIEVGEPDMEIYNGGRKSHSADLATPTLNFSVKTQTIESVRKYGMSWLMEKSSLKKFEGHHVILCMQLSCQEILVQNIVKFEDMLAVQAAPRLSYLTTKAAFYYQDILCNNIKGGKNE